MTWVLELRELFLAQLAASRAGDRVGRWLAHADMGETLDFVARNPRKLHAH